MGAGKYNVVIEQGADFELSMTYKTNNVAVNLTGYTARMMGREKYEDASPIFSLTTENGGITLGGSAGTIVAAIPNAQTRNFTFSTGYYDLELISPSGKVTRLLQGTLTLHKEATR